MILDYDIKEEEIIFGLDIGTRTVIGIVGFQKDEKFVVIDSEMVEHEARAMVDGQIHDIFKVSRAVEKVKDTLEGRLGIELKEVAIAAAGRVLKTYLVRVNQDLDDEKEIQRDTIKELELKGIDKAHLKLKEDLGDRDIEYFCVGYSVVNYYLNEYIINNLQGHKGKNIGADVLATFLPKSVVDSLYAVMERVGLDVVNLTLEPIAAINVAIPENLRLLNLALVDIGAGTSDIAITKEGSIIGYGMISIAGDEITEQIIHKYLVDFETAEKIKFQIGKKENISFVDILGLSHTITSEEILEYLEPSINKLAKEISEKIQKINGNKSPNAVFCVGGGSQIIGLIDKIAQNLNIPKERIALRGGDSLINVVYECEINKTPNMITPIGICVTYVMQKGYDFIEVKINREPVKLLNTKKLTVADVGIQKGFDHTNLLGRKGASITFWINNKRKKVWGEPAIPAEIYVNGKSASLDTPIRGGEEIIIQPAVNGKDAKAFIKDYISEKDIKKVFINGIEMKFSVLCTINGKFADINEEIHNGDKIELFEIKTIKDLAQLSDIDLNNKKIFVNGEEVDLNYYIKNGDKIDFKEKNISDKNNEDFIVKVNGREVSLSDKNKQYIFVDIFNFIDFDLKNPRGNIVLLLNGKRAAFTDPIKPGDDIKIYWDKEDKE
ncbi:cell division protein FtsA [Defluviitalea phaphyphila]|uniref:cell division protein FtsA n=1 Tax=Defluviitalea phaphyphila TaxID=1473580 RepID=UPI000730C2AC|nr:cell division protein FtsA [Defluviitalea phaphyphila]